jgi:excisionase family DNA binding protein
MAEEEKMLTTRDIARRLGVNEDTARRWLRAGKLRGISLGAGKAGYRVRESDLEAFLKARERGGE